MLTRYEARRCAANKVIVWAVRKRPGPLGGHFFDRRPRGGTRPCRKQSAERNRRLSFELGNDELQNVPPGQSLCGSDPPQKKRDTAGSGQFRVMSNQPRDRWPRCALRIVQAMKPAPSARAGRIVGNDRPIERPYAF